MTGPFVDSKAATPAATAPPLNLTAASLLPLAGTDFTSVALAIRSGALVPAMYYVVALSVTCVQGGQPATTTQSTLTLQVRRCLLLSVASRPSHRALLLKQALRFFAGHPAAAP